MNDFLAVKNWSITSFFLTYRLGRVYFVFFLTLTSISVSFSQTSESEREINDAILNAVNGNYEQAILVLKKYADFKKIDNFETLQVNVYLNWCYFEIEDEIFDLNSLNKLTDFYLEKNRLSLNQEESKILYLLGNINAAVGNFDKMIFYDLKVKEYYDENEIAIDEVYVHVLHLIGWGYQNLKNHKLAIDFGKKSYDANVELFGEINEFSLKNLNLIYNSYWIENDFQNSLKYLLKWVDIGKEYLGEEDGVYLAQLLILGDNYRLLGQYSKFLDTTLKVSEFGKRIWSEKSYEYFTCQNNLAFAYSLTGDYEKSLKISFQVIELGKELLGEKHPDYLTSLATLANTYSLNSDYKPAVEILQKVEETGKEVLGENHPNYLIIIGNLGFAYSGIGEYKKALELHLKVVELKKELLGERHPDYFTSLVNLANSYSLNGDDKSALEILKQMETNGKIILGENHPNYLSILGSLALAYSGVGENQKALELQLKVVELGKELLGEKHPGYLTSLENLANTYSLNYDYKSAIEILQKVEETGNQVLRENHPNNLRVLGNLAFAYLGIGEYQKALELHLKIVELGKELLGEKHPDNLTSLENLANNYNYLGDYQSALKIHLKAEKIGKDILGENHVNYLRNLGNMTISYLNLGEYKKSLEICLKVVEGYKQILGDKHPYYFSSLSNLAESYSGLGDNQSAIDINKKVEVLRKEHFGERNPVYLRSLGNLANSYYQMGDYHSALEIELKNVKLGEDVLGEKHPDYWISLSNLAFTELKLSKIDSAFSHINRSLNLRQERAIDYFGELTESQREQFWNTNRYLFNIYPLFLEEVGAQKSEGINFLYGISLFTKGLLLNTNLDFDQLLAEKGAPEAISKFQDLKLLRLQIQRLYEKPISDRILNVDSLEIVAQKLETELVKLSKEYGDYTRNLKITWEEVQSNLGEKDVAIEFLEYPTLTDTVKYAALVLRRGWENPKFVPLFRKDQIDEIVNRDPNQIYSNGIIGKETRKLVWDPLEKFIAPGDKVHFSAAGILHQLAIENLSYDDSTTLGDRYQMYMLSSTKELALKKPESKNQNVALYGGIKYDLSLDQMIAGSKKYGRKDSFLAVRGIDEDSLDRKGLQFLPGTLAEANGVGEILRENKYQVTEFIGEAGSEESLKDLSGKKTGIIHIATHGFFLPVEQSQRNPFIQMKFDDRNDNAGYVDPMLRSGLLLAGGNRAWQGDSIPDTIEDGVLTAKEISHLDLRETDLVVLSACETGLGDVSSEGVFGLQRAFKQAGAQTIIMSLWNVEDEATQYLMTNFYSYLTQGASKREAFIQARNKCRDLYQDPASWAAFIMLD